MQAQIEEKCGEYKIKDKNDDLSKKDPFPSSLQKSIENIVKKEGFITNNVFKRTISTDGGNYLGVLYEIDIKGKTAYGDKETNIFVKTIIPGDNMNFFSVNEAYLKELYAYTELAMVLKELQDNADIPIHERFKMVKSYDESNSEAIMLENLSKKGFKTCHRMDVIPLKFAEQSIQQLAKFHALSIILQKRRPEYFNRKIKVLEQPFKFTEEWKEFYKNMMDMSTKKLRYDSKKKLENYTSVILDKFPKYMEDFSMTGACLCHGDYRPNNVLLKETDGEISEVIPIDFQLLYYGCPLNDFLYFIFCGTDQKFRKKHLTDLKNMYYDTLATFLKYFDVDVNEVYPRNEFERQYEERLDFGLMIAMYLVPLCFAAEDSVPDLGTDDVKTNFNMDCRFQERVQGIVDDFEQWGFL